MKRHFYLRYLAFLGIGVFANATASFAQTVWNVCSGNTYEYAYCSINPTAANCNACTLSYVGGDATGYVITRGAYNGAYTTTINWTKAGTYTLYYSCETPNARTVTVGQGETIYAVTGGGVLCGGSRTIRLTNSESLTYALRKGTSIYGSPKSGAPGRVLEWNVTEAGTFDVLAMYGCTQVKTNQPALIGSATVVGALAYNVGGGGSYCAGGTGISVTLSGSQVGVSYELYKDNVFVSPSTQAGTGSLLIWNNLSTAGTYTIQALGDCGTRWSMTGQATIISNTPAIFAVSGGGSYCSGGLGLPISLSGSQTGVKYQLKIDGVNSGEPLTGTGNALGWPAQTSSGTFTVVANNNSCSVTMSGSATISVVPLLAGATMSNAINVGSNVTCISYADQKTIGSGNCYGADYGTGGDDIYYKFTTTYASSLTASHCGSAISTQLFVFNAAGAVVATKVIDASANCQEQNKLQISIAPGTYFVMSKAVSGSGVLATQINLVVTEELNLSPVNATLREDQSIVLTIPDAMVSIINWTPSDNTIESTTARTATVRPGKTTTYVVKGIVNGCEVSAKGVVTIQTDITNRNYVKETIVLTSGVQSVSQMDLLDVNKKSVKTTYIDGLGRNDQTVSWQSSPAMKDAVQPFVYDKFGREFLKYAPYVSNSFSGQYKVDPVGSLTSYNSSPHHAFYTASNDKVANDDQPYARTVFDASPLSEVVKQGAQGSDWQADANVSVSTDKSIKKRYANNQANEVLHFTYNMSTGALSLTAGSKYYEAGQLSVSTTVDEQGHEVVEYTDKLGRILLKKVEYDSSGTTKLYAGTYYIYNDLGDLSVVLPPQAVKILTDCGN